MFLDAAKLHILVLLVTTYGYEQRYPIPEQILEAIPYLKNNDNFAGRLSGTWRKNEEEKTLENVEQSTHSEDPEEPGNTKAEEDVAITTNYDKLVDLGSTEQSIIEEELNEPEISANVVDSQNNLTYLYLPVKLDNINSSSTPGVLPDLVESSSSPPRPQIKEEQRSPTKKAILETQNGFDNPAEPAESTVTIDEAVESINVTRPQIKEEQGSSTKKAILEIQNGFDNPAEPEESIVIIDEAVESINVTRPQIKEEQGSSTKKAILEIQNGFDNPAEPEESIVIRDEAIESINVTEKTLYTPDLKKPKKDLTIPVPKAGDLILTRSQFQEISKNNFNLSKYRWPDRIVPIVLSQTFNSREKLTILYAVDMIENRTCIKFSTRRRSDINYVQVMKRKEKPISSNLGCISGPQVVNLHQANTYDILHEFMHTLGIPHQHSVSKRDDHIKIISENIRPKLRGQFIKLGEGEDYEYLNDYDLQSIMHFDKYAASKNGNATIVAISGEIEPSVIPTDKDYEKLNKLYECDKAK